MPQAAASPRPPQVLADWLRAAAADDEAAGREADEGCGTWTGRSR